jgi:hypothetical protein
MLKELMGLMALNNVSDSDDKYITVVMSVVVCHLSVCISVPVYI